MSTRHIDPAGDSVRDGSGRLSSDEERPAGGASATPDAVPFRVGGSKTPKPHGSGATKASAASKGATPSARAGGAAGGTGAGGLDAGDAFDPELEADLGAEFELRGDVMEAELEAARAEAADLRDRVARGQAEFDNFRKRTSREREEERKRAGERLVSELLPAIDNLERAIEHTTAGGDLVHLLAGVEAVHAQVITILGKEGVAVIDPFGQPFDHNTQQAVSQQEDAEVPADTVVAVFQKGYQMGGRVIRPAMVVVSTGGPKREE